MNGTGEAEHGDLQALLGMLRRRLGLIVVGVVVGVSAALIFSALQDKSYQSTAGLLFRPLLLDVQVTGLPLQLPSGDPAREAETNLDLVSLGEVRRRAAARLGAGYTPSAIKKNVDVEAEGKSNIARVNATAPTPETAARVANTVAGEFVAFRREGLRAQVRTAMARVRGELRRADRLPPAQRRALRANLQRLRLLGSVQTGDVQLVERATPPDSPSSPKLLRNAVISGVLGLVLGLALALGAEALDRRVRRPEQLEEALGLPLLSTVPRSKALRTGELWKDQADGDAEAFRRLRANLRYFAGSDREINSVLVTSADAGSGKTTVALHLAAATAAGAHGRVLLIEADLRQPTLAGLLGLPTDRGLSTVLQSAAEFDGSPVDGVVTMPLGQGSNGGASGAGDFAQSFDALPAGPPPPDASELLDSQRMGELLRAARRHYDLIVVDAPPPALVSDAIPLMKQVDGVILVGRLGKESAPVLRRLRAELDRLEVRPLGAVANFSPRVSNPYYHSSR